MNEGKIFDKIRRKWVADLPEEKVRQQLIEQMVTSYHYPPSLLAVEVEVRRLPHLQGIASHLLPLRRIDLLVFAKEIHPHWPLYPLLIVECKGCPLHLRQMRQLAGYNNWVKAPFIALCNGDKLLMSASINPTSYEKTLPTYQNLIERVKNPGP